MISSRNYKKQYRRRANLSNKITYVDSKGKKYDIDLFDTTLSFPCPTAEEIEALKRETEKRESQITFKCYNCGYLTKGRTCKNCGSKKTEEYAGSLHLEKVLELGYKGFVNLEEES